MIKIPFDVLLDTIQIFEGCYDIQDEIKSVVDIGACIGAFSVWASVRYDRPRIWAYEPIYENFKILEENASMFPNVEVANKAVGDVDVLFSGITQRGLWSKYRNSNISVNVEKILPGFIPDADFLKIDTEGMEIEILEKIKPERFKYIALEYHSKEDIEKGEKLLEKDFNRLHGWWADYSDNSGRGVFRYENKAGK